MLIRWNAKCLNACDPDAKATGLTGIPTFAHSVVAVRTLPEGDEIRFSGRPPLRRKAAKSGASLRASLLIAAIGVTLCAAALPARSQTSPKHVAIAGWGPHPSLVEVVQGFKKGLADEGFVEGTTVIYDETNVNFDGALIPQMLARLAGARPDLMAAVATPVAIASKQVLRDRTFPIVALAINDPVHAKLVPSWESSDKLMTAASVAVDFPAALQFFKKLLPNMKRVGVLFDTGDDSSKVSVDQLEAAATPLGLTVVQVGVDNPSELAQRVQSAIGRVDALFTVASGKIQQGMAAISATADRAKLPVITSVVQTVQQNYALAAFGVSYGESGVAGGRMAGRILKGADPASIPPYRASASEHEQRISKRKLESLGMALPAALADCKCVVD
jgi:putative tryptophan/tyrosine transport system substrate-binding protein